MVGGSAPFTGIGTLLAWVRAATVAQQGSQFVIISDGGTTNLDMLGTERAAASGKITCYQGKTGSNSAATETTVMTANTWQLAVAAFGPYPTSQIAYLDTNPKATTGGIINPPSLNQLQLGGRGTQDMAHAGTLTRVITDLEVAALKSVFLNPRALGLTNYYYVNATGATETDQVGSNNLTVTGTSALSGDPNIGTWFTGSAIANQSWTQGAAITSIDLTTKFDNGVAATAPWTGTLKQLGAAGTPTTASGGAATPSTQITTAAALTSGQWVKVGSNALVAVLYASGTTALLGTAITWNDADTVTPFPVGALTAITSNGVTVNGSNQITGTPGAGAVGTYANCVIQATNNTNAGAIAYSNLFSITVASSGAAASFSAGPSLTSANTDGYTFGGTSNQTATWYTCVLLKGSATPTAAQVRTGSPTGFISRFSVAVTLNIAAVQTVTGLSFPFHDVYHVLNNGSGDSAVSANLALFKAAPSGKQYVTAALNAITAITKANPAAITTAGAHGRTTGDWVEVFDVGGMTQINGTWVPCTVVDGTHITLNGIDSTGFSTFTSGGKFSWGRSSFAGSSTPILSGDILVADVTDGQGAPVSFTAEGVAIFTTNSPARQSFVKDVYSVSLGNFIGSATEYENDSPPVPPGQTGLLPYILFPLNQQSSIPVAPLFTDPQGDDLTNGITADTSLPPGRSLVAGSLTGTPTANAVTAVTFRAANRSLESSTVTVNIVDGGIAVPSLTGTSSDSADNLLAANYLLSQSGSQDDPTPGGPAPLGHIISQAPPAGTIVAPGSLVIYAVSTGFAPLIQITVPDVSSSPADQATATATLQAAGFVVVVPQSWTGTIKITQYPNAGSMLNAGSVVTLFLTGGAPTPKRRSPPKKRVIPTQKPRMRIIVKTPGKNHR